MQGRTQDASAFDHAVGDRWQHLSDFEKVTFQSVCLGRRAAVGIALQADSALAAGSVLSWPAQPTGTDNCLAVCEALELRVRAQLGSWHVGLLQDSSLLVQ